MAFVLVGVLQTNRMSRKYVCIYEKLYLCVCVYIYIYMYLHIHTYIIPQEQEEMSIPTQEDREFAFP